MVKSEKDADVKRIRTATITFRLPSNIIEALRKEAEPERPSVNTRRLFN
jgi:hypothetical protein